jgi:S1-C subfamily serine protease
VNSGEETKVFGISVLLERIMGLANHEEETYLGIYGKTSQNGTMGIEVTKSAPGSPAEKAGILSGDILTEIDGNPVASVNALEMLIAKKNPGESVLINISGKGEITVYLEGR